MKYPLFSLGLRGAGASQHGEDIHSLDLSRLDDPSGYRPSEGLSHAVNVALILGKPLLVTGEPGTGKTQLAYAVAQELGGLPVRKFETKSTSVSRDLFYVYDAMSAFKRKEVDDPRAFIHYQALGHAILEAFPRDEPTVAHLIGGETAAFDHRGPRRSVVLIDEVDKAPRDFPNDLLNEIDRLYFRVPELGNVASPGLENEGRAIPPNRRPIIIITSNSEKALPEPFLRRCVFFNIPFPDQPGELERIVASRLEGFRPQSPLLTDALDLFRRLRGGEQGVRLRKPPSTAELLDWLQALQRRDLGDEDRLTANKEVVEQTLCALVKVGDDLDQAARFLQDWSRG